MEIPPNNPPQFVLIGCVGAGITLIDRIGKAHMGRFW
jgi:hypothetical protein